MPDETSKPDKMLNLWRYIVSFVIGCVIAGFTVGGVRQKVVTVGKDMEDWKREWKEVHAPRIDRMDSIGSLSFDHFHKQYEKDQSRIDEHLKNLDKDVKELQKKVDP